MEGGDSAMVGKNTVVGRQFVLTTLFFVIVGVLAQWLAVGLMAGLIHSTSMTCFPGGL